MFKEDLALWLVLIAIHEPEISEESVRMKFIQHWERGVQLMAEAITHSDWMETVGDMIQ